jgi:hypothetical protein
MDQPPVIPDQAIEVRPVPRPGPEAEPAPEHQSADAGPPIHALSALIMVAVDNLWNLADWAVISWAITVPLSFVTVFFPVFLLQKTLKKDRTSKALAFAFLLGGLAAIPTSITGTPVGLGLLAWSGLSRLLGRGHGPR